MRLTLCTTLTLFCVNAWGQSPAPQAFEAASIKPSAPGKLGGGMNLSAARMRIVNSSLKFCVEMAWNVKDFQVTGATGWMDNDHYDIDAVAAAPFKAGEYRGMFQALLADRFGLVVHRETKDRPGYALVIAKNGSKLPPPAEEPDVMFGRTPSGDVSLKARKATLAQLAGVLSSMLGVVVVNQTGIEGRYDVSLQYTPDPTSQPALGKPGVTPPPPPADAVPGPSIFDALQEKLGLKLEARKVPVEMVVIDRANRPSEN